jgi:hypothetical protein
VSMSFTRFDTIVGGGALPRRARGIAALIYAVQLPNDKERRRGRDSIGRVSHLAAHR